MISKELLSEVLEIRVHETYFRDDGKLGIDYFKGDNNAVGFNSSINTYELAHKCKEWASSNGFIISSTLCTCNIKTMFNHVPLHNFYGDTEPDAIFKACQHILDNKDK